MTKSMVGIFNDLTNNRKERTAAEKKFVVVSLKKNGTPCKVTPQMLNDMNATVTMEQAVARQAEMTRLNPNSTFVVVDAVTHTQGETQMTVLTPHFLSTVTSTPTSKDYGSGPDQIRCTFGDSRNVLHNGALVYIRRNEDTIIVLSMTGRNEVRMSVATAKHFLRTVRKNGKAVVDASGKGNEIAKTIDCLRNM